MFLLIRNDGTTTVKGFTDIGLARKAYLEVPPGTHADLVENNEITPKSQNTKRDESIFELSIIFHNMFEHGDIDVEAFERKKPTVSIYEAGRSLVFDLADEFESIHKDTDWNEEIFYDEISKFGKERIRKYFNK